VIQRPRPQLGQPDLTPKTAHVSDLREVWSPIEPVFGQVGPTWRG